jgi:hypothetical protein
MNRITVVVTRHLEPRDWNDPTVNEWLSPAWGWNLPPDKDDLGPPETDGRLFRVVKGYRAGDPGGSPRYNYDTDNPASFADAFSSDLRRWYPGALPGSEIVLAHHGTLSEPIVDALHDVMGSTVSRLRVRIHNEQALKDTRRSPLAALAEQVRLNGIATWSEGMAAAFTRHHECAAESERLDDVLSLLHGLLECDASRSVTKAEQFDWLTTLEIADVSAVQRATSEKDCYARIHRLRDKLLSRNLIRSIAD